MDANLEPILRVAELRELEAAHDEAALMELAGRAAADVARTMAGERGGRTVVLAGPGNNGGGAVVGSRRPHNLVFHNPGGFSRGAPKIPRRPGPPPPPLLSTRRAAGTPPAQEGPPP